MLNENTKRTIEPVPMPFFGGDDKREIGGLTPMPFFGPPTESRDKRAIEPVPMPFFGPPSPGFGHPRGGLPIKRPVKRGFGLEPFMAPQQGNPWLEFYLASLFGR